MNGKLVTPAIEGEGKKDNEATATTVIDKEPAEGNLSQ